MRPIDEINREIRDLSEHAARGGKITDEKIYALTVEAIEAQPTMEHKIACLRSFVRGRCGLQCLPEDVKLLSFNQHQA